MEFDPKKLHLLPRSVQIFQIYFFVIFRAEKEKPRFWRGCIEKQSLRPIMLRAGQVESMVRI
jgi:hypothetical protein